MEGAKTPDSILVVISVIKTASKDLSESNKYFAINYLGHFKGGSGPAVLVLNGCPTPRQAERCGEPCKREGGRRGPPTTDAQSTPDGQKADLCKSWDSGLPLLCGQRILDESKVLPSTGRCSPGNRC